MHSHHPYITYYRLLILRHFHTFGLIIRLGSGMERDRHSLNRLLRRQLQIDRSGILNILDMFKLKPGQCLYGLIGQGIACKQTGLHAERLNVLCLTCVGPCRNHTIIIEGVCFL